MRMMKKHVRHLVIVILANIVAFGAIFALSMGHIIYLAEDNWYEERIYIASIAAVALVHIALYSVFWRRERKIADTAHNAEYLDLGTCIFRGVIALVVALAFFFIITLGATAVLYLERTIAGFWWPHVVFFLAVLTVINFGSFCYLKPRY